MRVHARAHTHTCTPTQKREAGWGCRDRETGKGEVGRGRFDVETGEETESMAVFGRAARRRRRMSRGQPRVFRPRLATAVEVVEGGHGGRSGQRGHGGRSGQRGSRRSKWSKGGSRRSKWSKGVTAAKAATSSPLSPTPGRWSVGRGST